MKTKHIFTCIFSLIYCLGFGQDSLPQDSTAQRKYVPNFMVGIDVLNIGSSFFSDRKVYQGFVSSRIKKNIHAVADLGYERNVYLKNGYDSKVMGPYLRVGGFYMLATDPENEFNGFYGGAKLAASFYRQTYDAVPVRGFGGSSSTVSFPGSSQSSYWVEGAVGGRVQLFNSSFYIDVNAQPKFLVSSTKQEDIKPMIVPGFGRSSSKFGMGFMWNIAYRF